jgi:hypothetical protein
VIEFSLDYLVAILENIPLVQYFLMKYFMNQLALVDFVIAIVSKKSCYILLKEQTQIVTGDFKN